jgi:hypothetical protein
VFVVTVDLDGTSTVNTLEGRVATYGRNGEIRLTSSGQTAQVTARKYSEHLAKKGVATSGGNWRNAPRRTQERVDNETVGNIFGAEGSGVLAAVLANPDASPTDGVNAMAIEASSSESGSIFVDSPIDGNLSATDSDPGRGQTLTSSDSELSPDSTLVDQGLPTLTPPHVGSSDPIGHVIGTFSLPSMNTIYNNFIFDLNLNTGAITNGAFFVDYQNMSAVYVSLGGKGGTGSLDLNTLVFNIYGFTVGFGGAPLSEFDDNMNSSTVAKGHLGPNTLMAGNFGGPINFGQTMSGTLAPEYVSDNMYSSTSNLESTYSLGGSLKQLPLVFVDGEFNFGGIPNLGVNQNYYEFILDLNNNLINDAVVRINYDGTSTFTYDFNLYGGTGSVTGNSFSISGLNGHLETSPGGACSTACSITGAMNGQFNTATPNVGSSVVPASGSFTYSPTPAASALTSAPILNGQVTKYDQ